MKMIEDMLERLKIPKPGIDSHFSKLRADLMQTFINPQRVYQLRFRWAASIAIVFFLLLVLAFSSPHIVEKVNTFAFGKEEAELKESKGVEPYPLASSYANASTSIRQESTQPEKTYMIRQYHSPAQGRLMIVSEYSKEQNNNIIRKVSAGCY